MEKLHLQVEDFEQKRSKWLIINLVGFCIWDGLRIIDTYLLENYNFPILTGIMLLGWLIWLVGLIQIVFIGEKIKRNRHLTQILNDELVEINRFKTWRATLVMVALTQVLIIIMALFVPEISGIFAAELSIFVMVISAIGGFFYFNKESNGWV